MRIDTRLLRTRTGVALILVTGAILLWSLIAALRPLPARHLAMATGPPGSTYALAAERYRDILARNGVELKLVQTNGAVDNLRLLRDARSGVSAGFTQAGSVAETRARDVVSLGTVFYEAVWLFCRCAADAPLKTGPEMRVSIGPVGSADRPLALKLLALNGISPQQVQLFAYPPEQAMQALLDDGLDTVVLLSGWESPVVRQLARAEGITLRGFPRADAYVALDPTLSKLALPRGVADLAADRPPSDTTLIASKASLAVREDLHPALKYLLVEAAIEVHSRPGVFHGAGVFPAPEELDLPLSAEARQIYRTGPSFLQRTLPFWLAELVQRILILVVPVAGILYPLWSFVPKFYRWRIQRRIYRLYSELRMLESELRWDTEPERVVGRLDGLEQRVLELRVPAAYANETYSLKGHIRAVRADAARVESEVAKKQSRSR